MKVSYQDHRETLPVFRRLGLALFDGAPTVTGGVVCDLDGVFNTYSNHLPTILSLGATEWTQVGQIVSCVCGPKREAGSAITLRLLDRDQVHYTRGPPPT